jgi:hypothetical protein
MPAKPHPMTEATRLAIATNPSWGPDRIRKRLEVEVKGLGLPETTFDRLPSVSTIQRIKASFPHDDPDYLVCRWPDTFKEGVLPWEAAPSYFEMLMWFGPHMPDRLIHPLISLVRWYWRISQVAGESTDPVERRWLAAMLVIQDRLPDPGLPSVEDVEFYLAMSDTEEAPLVLVERLNQIREALKSFGSYPFLERNRDNASFLLQVMDGVVPGTDPELFSALMIGTWEKNNEQKE